MGAGPMQRRAGMELHSGRMRRRIGAAASRGGERWGWGWGEAKLWALSSIGSRGRVLHFSSVTQQFSQMGLMFRYSVGECFLGFSTRFRYGSPYR